MAGHKVLLFAYGRLQPDYNPPATLHSYVPDAIYGDMYDNKHDPLVVNVGGDYTDKIAGTLMTIDERELPYIDKEEIGYRRIETETASRKKAFVYIWDGKLPADAKRIKRWPTEK